MATKKNTASIRIKSNILFEVKLHCVKNGETVIDFVSAVLDKELTRLHNMDLKKKAKEYKCN